MKRLIFVEAPDPYELSIRLNDTMDEVAGTDFQLINSTSAFVFYDDVFEEVPHEEDMFNSRDFCCADCDNYWNNKCRCPYADGKVEPLRDACEHFANGGVH